MRVPRVLARALIAASAVLLLDIALSLLAIRDGMFLGRPLPPFGAITHPVQRDSLAHLRNSLASAEEPTGPTVFDPDLGWTNRPTPAGDPSLERINSLGARGAREYPLARPAGTTRVMCFGDSFTYGAEVADAEAWTAQLESLDPRVEAPNFGVPGYGTDQALLRFRGLPSELEADAVLIGFLLENIGRNVARYRPIYNPWTPYVSAKPRLRLGPRGLELIPLPFRDRRSFLQALEDGSVVARLGEGEYWPRHELPGLLRHSSLARLAAGTFAYRMRHLPRLYEEVEGEPFRTTLAILETFHREALARGARRAAVLVFPRERDLRRLVDGGDHFWSTLLDALAARSIPFLDLTDDLLGPYREEVRIGSAGLFVAREAHLSAAGNRIVAEAVLRWLRRNPPGGRRTRSSRRGSATACSSPAAAARSAASTGRSRRRCASASAGGA
ncbi:MAG: hypothetical protein L0323_21970 [Planctomycetes bacterium]|nr:hypothetical protein [Planctomycetota bacterium]